MTCTPLKRIASRGGSHSRKSRLSHPEPEQRQIVPVKLNLRIILTKILEIVQ